jgi:hypothetical protein
MPGELERLRVESWASETMENERWGEQTGSPIAAACSGVIGISKAERVISGWEAIGGLEGAKDAIRTISGATLYLGRVIDEWPVEDDPVPGLIRSYKEMRLKLRSEIMWRVMQG